jgi:hypothetical protein
MNKDKRERRSLEFGNVLSFTFPRSEDQQKISEDELEETKTNFDETSRSSESFGSNEGIQVVNVDEDELLPGVKDDISPVYAFVQQHISRKKRSKSESGVPSSNLSPTNSSKSLSSKNSRKKNLAIEMKLADAVKASQKNACIYFYSFY